MGPNDRNTFNFDGEFDESVSEVVENINKTTKTEISTVDLSEVERRLEIASHYRLLLQDRLFESTSLAARQVEAEVRAFVKERLEILVGMRQPTTAQTQTVKD